MAERILQVAIPDDEYDHLAEMARMRHLTVPQYARKLILKLIDKDNERNERDLARRPLAIGK